MTHSITREHTDHSAVYRVLVTVNITSLESAGAESFDPETEEWKDGRQLLPSVPTRAVNIVGWEDESKLITWDTIDSEFKVKNLSDGTDVASGTDVGEVLVEVRGE